MLAQLQLKLAQDYAAKQQWLISHAEVVDEDLSPELEQSLTRMLDGRANELNDKEREAVAAFLQQAGNIADNKPAPAPLGRIRRVADEVRKVPKRPRRPREAP